MYKAPFVLLILCGMLAAGMAPVQAQTARELEQEFNQQLKQNLLTTPENYNALKTLEQLKRQEPSHKLVTEGPKRIASHYAKLASRHASRGHSDKAYAYIEKALSFDAQNKAALQLRVELDLSRTEHLSGLGNGIVAIAAGCFSMGSPPSETKRNPDEQAHKVCVKEFGLAKYEVTFTQFDQYTDANGKPRVPDKGWGRGQRPVVGITWEQATQYAQWLSHITSQPYRLPTEAEWEFAARAGTDSAFYTGKKISKRQGNINADSQNYSPRGKTQPVGKYKENPWGLFDMHGNVWEWTCSAYNADYANKTELKCSDSKPHVLRGGSWYSRPSQTRAAYRGTSEFTDGNRGFRLAQEIHR